MAVRGLGTSLAFSTVAAGMLFSIGAHAQSVTVTGNVTPAGPTSPNWNTTDRMVVGDTLDGSLAVEGGGKAATTNYSAIGGGGGVVGSISVTGDGSEWDGGAGTSIGLSGTGTLRVEDGGFARAQYSVLGENIGASGTVVVTGHGSEWLNDREAYIGQQGYGEVNISGGGKVTTRDGELGRYQHGVGVVVVTGPLSRWDTTNLTVGRMGTGTLTIGNAGAVESAIGYVGHYYASTGTVEVTGNGSAWLTTDTLYLGVEGAATLTISDGALVDVAARTYSGWYSTGSATINIGAAAGDAAAAPGVLASPRIDFGDGMSTLVFNHTAAAGAGHAFTADLFSTGAGAHAIDHRAGVTSYTGNGSAFTGTTTINGGTFLVDGSLGGSTLVSGGILGGSGSLGGISILAGGVHAPGNSIGTQTVTGPYVNSGVLEIEIAPTGASDRLVANGTVDLSGGTLRILATPGATGWQNAETYTIIENGGGGAIAGRMAFENPFAFFDTDLDYFGGAGNDLVLSLTRNGLKLADVARTPSQAALAGAIDSGNPLHDALLTMSEDDVLRTLDSLSGEGHASGAGAMMQGSGAMLDAASNRIRAAFGGDGNSGGFPVMGYWPGGLDVVAPEADRFGVWDQVSANGGKRSGNGAAARVDADSLHVVAGADGALGDWLVGVYGGYGRTDFSSAAGAFSGRADSWHVGLYGGRQWGAISLRAGLTHGWHDIDTSRVASVGGISETLAAQYGARTAQVFGELGYTVETATARFEPFAGVTHVHHRTAAYTETGGALALTSLAATTNSTASTLGVRAETDVMIAGRLTTLRGTTGWRHAFGDVIPTATHAFATGGSAFTASGAQRARDTGLVELGIGSRLSANAVLDLSYNGSVARGYVEHGAGASLRIGF